MVSECTKVLYILLRRFSFSHNLAYLARDGDFRAVAPAQGIQLVHMSVRIKGLNSAAVLVQGLLLESSVRFVIDAAQFCSKLALRNYDRACK